MQAPLVFGREPNPRSPEALVGAKVQRWGDFRPRGAVDHEHRFVEMVFIVEGSCEHRIGNRVCAAGPGCLGIVHPGVQHHFVAETGSVQLYNIYCRPDLVPPPLPAGGLGREVRELLPLATAAASDVIVHLQLAEVAAVNELLARWEREQTTCAAGWVDICRSCYAQLMVHAARAVAAGDSLVRAGEGGATGRRIGSLRRELDRRFDRAWSLEACMAFCGLGRATLCRAFRRHTGFTVMRYLARRRLQHAQRLLVDSQLGIAAIATACGFASRNALIRCFRRECACSPSAWRRKRRAGL